MTIIPKLPVFKVKSPVYQLFVSLFAVLVIGTLLFMLLILEGSRIFDTDPGILGNPLHETGVKELSFIKYTLIVQDLSFFVIPALLILRMMNPGEQSGMLRAGSLRMNDIILVTILALCTFPVTGLAGQFNAGMVLPDRLSGVEQWMREKEDNANNLLELIMSPGTFTGMLLNIIIMAALPAISEELIFRGVFQRIFQNLFRSGHSSVWFTSLLFSSIHLQFYGFLPRLILGLIFGYLFLWSRNLWLPVIAHFLNNAVPTAGAYLKGWDSINQSSGPVSGNQIAGVIISLIIGTIVLFRLRQRLFQDKEGGPGSNHLPGI
jgi:membrane protease YdiL (CAAX protease family)